MFTLVAYRLLIGTNAFILLCFLSLYQAVLPIHAACDQSMALAAIARDSGTQYKRHLHPTEQYQTRNCVKLSFMQNFANPTFEWHQTVAA